MHANETQKKSHNSTATATYRRRRQLRAANGVAIDIDCHCEPPTRPKRKAATKATAALQPMKRKRSSPSITESDESLASVQTCPPTTSNSTALSRSKRRQLIKQTQMQNNSIITSIQKAQAQSQHVETYFTVRPCSPLQTYPTQYYISPNYEGPETSMTVGEAERLYESDTD